MNGLTPSKMSAEAFKASAFVLPVVRQGAAAVRALSISGRYAEKWRELEGVLRQALPGQASLIPTFQDRILDIDLVDDLFYSSLGEETTIIVVAEALYDAVGEEFIVEQVHCHELEDALRRGEEVPMALLAHYRTKLDEVQVSQLQPAAA